MHARILSRTQRPRPEPVRWLVIDVLNGTLHATTLAVYMGVVAGHVSEHLVQVAQVFVLGWDRPDAGGLLGLVFSGAAASEALHFTYNTLQLTGLILLAPGFRGLGAARNWWLVALVAQSWHWLEHAFLIVQFATGIYFYGAIKQMSVLERFLPRIELHFAYNALAFVPTIVAVALYLRHLRVRGARRKGTA